MAAAFLAGAFLAGAFLAGAFLAGAFLAGAFLAAAFLAGAFLAVGLAAPARAPATMALNSAPGRNLGNLVALIFTASPVRGLRPVRAARDWRSKTPNPLIATFSPREMARFTSCRMVSTTSDTSFLLVSSCAETASIRSALFTAVLSDVGVAEVGPQLQCT